MNNINLLLNSDPLFFFVNQNNLRNNSNFINNTIDNIVNETEELEIKKLTIYKQDGSEKKSINTNKKTLGENYTIEDQRKDIEELKKYLKKNKNDIIIIGNGGAGAIGFIKALADKYNKSVQEEEKLIVIWRAGHSFENFGGLDFIDAAITYEPHIESQLKSSELIEDPYPLFFNHFDLSYGKNDIFYIKESLNRKQYPFENEKFINYFNNNDDYSSHSYDFSELLNFLNIKIEEFRKKDHLIFSKNIDDAFEEIKESPLVIMFMIIIMTFLKVYWNQNDDWDEFKKIYASRYNHSAMGEKDVTLFIGAIVEIENFFMKYRKNYFIKKIIESLYLNDLIPINGEDSTIRKLKTERRRLKIFNAWMLHVKLYTTQFPWDIINEAIDNDYYHLNDKAFYIQKIISNNNYKNNLLTQIDYNDISNILINPGILWNVKNKIKFNSKQDKFLKKLRDQEFTVFIENWKPDNFKNQYWGNHAGLYKSNNYIDTNGKSFEFEDVYLLYTNHLLTRSNQYIDEMWFNWNPPQNLSLNINIDAQRRPIEQSNKTQFYKNLDV